MKFYTIQFPVTVSGDGHLMKPALATFSITVGDDTKPQDAVDTLVAKIAEAAKLVDTGDDT